MLKSSTIVSILAYSFILISISAASLSKPSYKLDFSYPSLSLTWLKASNQNIEINLQGQAPLPFTMSYQSQLYTHTTLFGISPFKWHLGTHKKFSPSFYYLKTQYRQHSLSPQKIILGAELDYSYNSHFAINAHIPIHHTPSKLQAAQGFDVSYRRAWHYKQSKIQLHTGFLSFPTNQYRSNFGEISFQYPLKQSLRLDIGLKYSLNSILPTFKGLSFKLKPIHNDANTHFSAYTSHIPLNTQAVDVNKIYEIVIINLAKRPERMQAISHALEQQGLRYYRIEAVNTTNCNPQELINRGQVDARFFDDPPAGCGAYGSFLSHKVAMKSNLTDAPYTLVFEDDVIIPSNLKQKLQSLYPNLLQAEFDMLILGQSRKKLAKVKHPTGLSDYYGCTGSCRLDQTYGPSWTQLKASMLSPGIYAYIMDKNKSANFLTQKNLNVPYRFILDIAIWYPSRPICILSPVSNWWRDRDTTSYHGRGDNGWEKHLEDITLSGITRSIGRYLKNKLLS